jgi:hypothetical protein
MIDHLHILEKHNIKIVSINATYNLNMKIDINNLDKIFVKNISKRKITFKNSFSTKISVNSKCSNNVRIFGNGLIQIITTNYPDLLLIIKKICEMLNVNISIIDTDIDIRLLQFHTTLIIDNDIIAKMNKYNPKCKITIEKSDNFNIYDLKYVYNKKTERTMIYKNNLVTIVGSSFEDTLGKYLHLYNYLQIPKILMTLSKETDSLFSHLPVELIEYIMFSL